jgi:hypothetical protein
MILPGSDFAAATSFESVSYGEVLGTTMTNGAYPTFAIGMKSLAGSKPRLEKSAALVASVFDAISSV